MAPRARAMGIDLGTTYTCVGVWRPGDRTVEIIPNEHGNRTTPSVVAFTDSERLIGQSAINQISSNPCNTVFDAKRLIGRRFSDDIVQKDCRLWPFRVVAGRDETPLIAVRFKSEERTFSAVDISAMLLLKMRDAAETYLGGTVKRAVITVPAYFNDSQRRATRDAGTVAGLEVLQILNEPTAAAVAYGLHREKKTKENILVFDLGGGTFDVSILNVQNKKITVRAVCGDTHLGGEDFNNRLVAHFLKDFETKNKINLCTNQRALRRLHSAAERAKRELSFATETAVEVPCLHRDRDFCATITRAKFEELNRDLFSKCMTIVSECLADASMTKSEINRAVLVGGSTRIPKVQELLVDFLGASDKVCKGIHPDEAVAFGAAVQAAVMNKEKYTTDIVFRDVTPLSLGISTRGGVMSVIVPRNTPVPVQKQSIYATVEDNQPAMRVTVYEGERPDCKQNNYIGMFDLPDLPPAPRGALKAIVSMEIDASGILTVRAEHKTLGLRQEVKFSTSKVAADSGGIVELIAEAENSREQDKAWKETVQARNELDAVLYDMRRRVESEILKGWMEMNTCVKINSGLESVSQWAAQNPRANPSQIYGKIKEVNELCSCMERNGKGESPCAKGESQKARFRWLKGINMVKKL